MSESISNDAGLAHLHELITNHPDFEVVRAPSVASYCFRYVPNGLADRQDESEVERLLDQLNQGIVEAVRRSGTHRVMTIAIGKRVALRMSICRKTLREDVDATFEAVARWGRLLTKTHSVYYEQPTEKEALPCSNEFCSSPMEA